MIQKRLELIFHFLRAQNEKILLGPPFLPGTQGSIFYILPHSCKLVRGKNMISERGGGNKYDFQCNIQTPAGTGADPIWSEPESAPGPQTSGAAEKKWRLRNTGAQSHFVQNHTSRGHFPTPRSFKELSKKGVLYRYLSVTLSTTPHCTTQR